MRPTRPDDVALLCHSQGVSSDLLGTWLFTHGDDVHWCAGFAAACARWSGNWIESKLTDQGSIRRVENLVNYDGGRRSFLPRMNGGASQLRNYMLAELASGRWSGALAVFRRDADPFGHVGVVSLSEVSHYGFNCVEGNSSDSIQLRRRSYDDVTAWVMIPWGLPS